MLTTKAMAMMISEICAPSEKKLTSQRRRFAVGSCGELCGYGRGVQQGCGSACRAAPRRCTSIVALWRNCREQIDPRRDGNISRRPLRQHLSAVAHGCHGLQSRVRR